MRLEIEVITKSKILQKNTFSKYDCIQATEMYQKYYKAYLTKNKQYIVVEVFVVLRTVK